jgi:hypothetical protein
LYGVTICQVNTINCTYTDKNGLFHLIIDKKYSSQLSIEGIGYKTLTISNLDTISDFLKVKLTVDTLSDIKNHITNLKTDTKQILNFGFIALLQVDFIFNDFGEFRSLLKDYNVDLMNKSSGTLSIELAGTYKRFYAGFNIGWASNNDYKHDSLDIEFNTTQYGLHFGYNLLNTKRILFTPNIAIKWNRYRLLNNNKDNSIPIEQYISERDLDLRFNQITGFVGFNLSYKLYNSILFPDNYWTFGIYGGYAFKLNDYPWIYSRANRLTSDKKIGVENYNFGIHFSFNFE